MKWQRADVFNRRVQPRGQPREMDDRGQPGRMWLTVALGPLSDLHVVLWLVTMRQRGLGGEVGEHHSN